MSGTGYAGMEFRRVFCRWKLWIAVLAAVCANIFLFIQTQEREYGTAAGYYGSSSKELFLEYERQLKQLEGLAAADAYDKIRGTADQVQKAVDEGREVDWTLQDYVRQYMMLPLLSYQKGYPEYLEKISRDTRNLSRISIFSDSGSFSSRNLEVTAEDFKGLTGVLARGNYYGVLAVMEYRITDYLFLLLMMLVCWQMMAERRSGLSGIVRLARGGRMRLAWKRYGMFLFAAFLFGMFLYGSLFYVSMDYFGVPRWNAAAQSLQELGKLPLAVSLGVFFRLYLVLRAGGMFFLALLFWLVLSAAENTAAALAAGGILLAIEYVLFAFLPVQSLFHLLKYCNLFSYFYTERLFIDYLNMNLFGYPVNALRLLAGLLPPAFLCASAAVIVVNGCKYQEQKGRLIPYLQDRIQRLADGAASRLHGFGMELYKCMIVHKGWIYLILMGWLLCRMYPVFTEVIHTGKKMLDYRLEEWENPVDAPALSDAMKKEKAYLDEQYAAYDKKLQAYQQGRLKERELDIAVHLLEDADNRRNAYIQIEQRLSQLEDAGKRTGRVMWLFNSRWMDMLFLPGSQDGQRHGACLAALFFLILFLAPFYAYEKQSGMVPVIRGTARGRVRLVLRKQAAVLLITAVVEGMAFGAHFYSIVRIYGLHGLPAPVQSVEWMAASDWHLTAAQFVLLIYVLRFVVLWSFAQMILLLSGIVKKAEAASAAGVFLLLAPSALWAAGVDSLKYISMAWYLSLAEILEQAGYRGRTFLLPYFFVLLAAAVCTAISSLRWIYGTDSRGMKAALHK